jgi:hypothetical protein
MVLDTEHHPDPVVRVELEAELSVTSGPVGVGYRDDNYRGVPGWREVVAVPEPGLAFTRSSAPRTLRSKSFGRFPEHAVGAPPYHTQATIECRSVP